MQNVHIDKTPVNVELLDSELKLALGALVFGVSTGSGKVVVHMDDSATQANIDQVTQIVNAHDHTGTTTDQDTATAQQSRIDAARVLYVGNPLDLPQASIADIGERVVWLQDEIEQLRGLTGDS